jgi:hypothetical protein
VIIIADQAGNVNYNAASVSQSFNVEMGNQVITFNTLPGKTFGDPSFTLSATGGGSGNPVTYTSSNGLIATCSGAQGESVTISGAGTIAITADQPGNSNWNPAASVIQYLIVAKATPLISNFSAVGKTWGDAPFTLNASSPGSGAFSFSSSNTSVATISGNTVTITGAGTSTLTAIQDPDDNYVSASTTALLTVAKAGQTITITGLPADISLLSFEGSPIQAEATSTSGLTVSLTLGVGSVATLDGSNLLTSSGATGTVVVEAAQAGNLNFNSATASLNFTVSKLPQTITFEAHPVKNVGDPPFDLAGSSTSSLDISFASGNTDVATVSGKSVAVVGAGTSVITASQAGNAYYDAATPVTQTLTVEACTGTVNPTDGGAIAADQNSCTAFDPALITSTSLATGHKGTLEYKWQSTVAPFSTWSDISSSNTDAYDPPAISETTKFRRVARVTCSSDWVLAAASNTVVMTVNGTIPSTPGAITGIAAQCPGLSGETYSIAPVEYASTYTWTVPTGWFVTDGDGTTSITVNTGSEGQDGSITVTAGNCGSNSSASSLAVTVSSPVPFTPPTVTDLVASGSPGAIIKWYHDATGGSALASSTTLEDGHHYYASQTLNGCESTSRFEVTASVDATPCKPTGIAAQSFSSGATVSSLLATGSKIRWYASSSGGAALATTTLLVNGAHYWASQTINCTESFTRFEVIATIN